MPQNISIRVYKCLSNKDLTFLFFPTDIYNQEMSFAPASFATTHHGKSRTPTEISLREFYIRCEPTEATYLRYDLIGDKMVNIRQCSTRSPSFEESITQLINDHGKIILLDARWNPGISVENMDGFFNHILSTEDVSIRFHNGFVGIGMLRMTKSIFMLLLTSDNEQQAIYRSAFFRILGFLYRLVRIDNEQYEGRWFGPVRVAIEVSGKMEDVLIECLAETVLGCVKTQARTFRSFELALHRALERNCELKNNMLMPLVLLFKTYLIRDDMRDDAALDKAFRVLELPSYSNLDVVNALIGEMFRELRKHASAILVAAESSLRFYPPETIGFSDGSRLMTRTTMPYGIQAMRGEIEEESDGVYRLNVDQVNDYIPILFDIPADGALSLTFSGQPLRDSDVNKYGPGVLVRSYTSRPHRTEAFRGQMGLTLRGGFGTGIGAPSVLRARPAFLDGTEMPVILGTVIMDRVWMKLSSPSWTAPIEQMHNITNMTTIGAVYFKGIKDITFTVRHEIPIAPITADLPGFRLSEMRTSRFESLQERAMH